MVINLANRLGRNLKAGLEIGTLALGLCLSAMPASAQQDPQQQDQPQQNQQQQQDQQQQDQQQQQAQAPQAPQDATPQNAAPDGQQNDQQNGQQNAPQDNYTVPDSLTLATGALVQVRTTGWLSSDGNKVGDNVILTLDQPLVVDGLVVARRGQTVIGRVAAAERAGRVKGVSKLAVSLSQLTLVDGQLVNVQTALIKASGGTSNGRDALGVVGTTGFGAAVGAAAAGGPGAAIGAGAGFVAGITGVLLTRGRPTIIPPESLLTFRVETPINISTIHGQVAFQPVNPEDYGTNNQARRPRRGPGPYPYPPRFAYAYPYGYPYGYPGVYPGLYVGYYGGWGYGRRWGWR
jgi:FKBP-type peptidyl-prolyl cis-trans isomerase